MKVSDRGQVTIPAELRRRYGLLPNVEVEFVATEEGLVLRKRAPGRHPIDELWGLLGREGNTDAYIEEIRGR
ncbi:MAG: AbrB/MazE/SpoVT family DNA-binding domain-containing protein [Armatimonadota bacterium]